MTHCLTKLLHLASKQDPSLESRREEVHFIWNTLVSLQCTALFSFWLLSVSPDTGENRRSVTTAHYWECASQSWDCLWIQENSKESTYISCDLKPRYHMYALPPPIAALHALHAGMSFSFPLCYTEKPFGFSCNGLAFEMVPLSVSQKDISVALLCLCSGNIIFMIFACASRRKEKNLTQSLFYKMLPPSWYKH